MNREEAHHALRVLRLRPGDPVVVLDGAGREYHTEVVELGQSTVRLRVRQQIDVPPPPCQLTLLQAIPKGKLLDSILQKATELGAARVVPLVTERVVTRLDDERSEHKLERWQKVVVEAAKQSGAAWMPRVDPPCSPAGFLARQEPFDLTLIASLQPGSRHPRECFEAWKRQHGGEPRSVCIWVGPEGDFTAEEVAAAEAAGALPITLGRLVLRVETAATYCLSIVNYELLAQRGSPTGP